MLVRSTDGEKDKEVTGLKFSGCNVVIWEWNSEIISLNCKEGRRIIVDMEKDKEDLSKQLINKVDKCSLLS